MIINIETMPGQARRPASDFEAPSNYKDPEKIREAQEEKAERDYWSQATDPTRARIYCVSMLPELRPDPMSEPWSPFAVHDFREPTIIVDRGLGEGDVLERCRPFLSANPGRVVAFNGVRFDFPVLAARFLRYGLLEEAKRFLCPTRWGTSVHVDPLLRLGGEGTLDAWAEFFGLPRKTGLDNPCTGGELLRAWALGRADRSELLIAHTTTRVVWCRALQALIDRAQQA